MTNEQQLRKLMMSTILDLVLTTIIGLTLIGGTLLISYKLHPPLPIAYLLLSIITILTTLAIRKKYKKHIQKLIDYEKLIKPVFRRLH